jgi:hypothetical protein
MTLVSALYAAFMRHVAEASRIHMRFEHMDRRDNP